LRRRRRQGELTKKVVLYTFAVIFMLTILIPIIWTILTAFQPLIEIYQMPPFPFRETTFTISNFYKMFNYPPFTAAIWHSALVAGTTAGFVMTAGALGAYTLARLRFRGRKTIFNLVMVLYMLPGLAMLIPMVITLRVLGLTDTYLGLVFAHSIFILPLMTWFLVGIFEGVPADLEDAAQVDGQTKLGSLVRVIIPLSIGGFALVSVFAFIMSWNELMFSMSVGIREFKLLQPTLLEMIEPTRMKVGEAAAAGLVSAAPVVALAVILQRYIIAGIMRGAIK